MFFQTLDRPQCNNNTRSLCLERISLFSIALAAGDVESCNLTDQRLRIVDDISTAIILETNNPNF